MTVTYRPAETEDAALLADLYNAAFLADYLRYGECPGYGRTPEQMTRSIQEYPKTLILCQGTPVGVLSAREIGEGSVYVGCLCVIPEYQGKGIGTRAMAYLEAIYPQWRQISLVTPADKPENIRFYTQRCGFSLAGEETDGSVQVAKLVKRRVI